MQDEAREACQHYNLSVVKGEDGGAMGGEWIEWRKTDFKERRDPKKGHVVPLRPWKMCKTIESKLNGATRLAVCRGEVSGEGATLSHVISTGAMSPEERIAAQQQQQCKRAEEAAKRANEAARLQQQREAAEKIEVERRRKAEKEAAKLAELKQRQKEKEKRRREAEEKERQRQLALKLAEQERQENLRRETEEKKRLEEEARAREAERIRREKEAAARAEAERKRTEEVARLAAIEQAREKERKRAEAAEQERQRQIALKRAEDERRAAEAKIRAEEEAARAVEAARIAEEARLRSIREEEERKEREWQRKIEAARKEMAFRRWRRRVDDAWRGIRQTHRTLEHLDPTYPSSLGLRSLSQATAPSSLALQAFQNEPLQTRPQDLFYRLGNLSGRQLNLSSFVADGLIRAMPSSQKQTTDSVAQQRLTEASSRHYVSLFKMALVMPTFDGTEVKDANLYETLSIWMHSRFTFDVQFIDTRLHDGKQIEVRSVVVENQDVAKNNAGCDYALFIIPPYDASRRDECFSFLAHQASDLSHNYVPSVVLNLDDGSDGVYSKMVRNLIDKGGQVIIGEVSPNYWTADGLDASLTSCCDMIRSAFVGAQVADGEPFVIDRVSLPQLGRLCLRNILWDTENLIVEDSVQATEHGILRMLKATIKCLALELNDVTAAMRGSLLSSWPSHDFAADDLPLSVANYWPDGAALPLNWLAASNACTPSSPLDDANVDGVLMEHFQIYRIANTISAVVEQITAAAPSNVKERCKKMLWDMQYRHALENALAWQESVSKPISTAPTKEIIYLPRCEIAGVIERTSKRVSDTYVPKDNVPALAAETTLAVSLLTPHKVVDADWKVATWKPAALSRGKRRPEKVSNEASAHPSHRNKRQRSSKKKPSSSKRKKALTSDQEQSMEFSARLKELLNGETTLDVNIGDVALSDILGMSGVGIKIPEDLIL